ncbi:hypothetical protein TWF506_001144 [Arthrobotrys conoides]|uniref:Uncharacterized protein n=1 Tax=Arthrobotrys conoides TaxID=74498 RepID=A0AAN8PRN3_9PEZI
MDKITHYPRNEFEHDGKQRAPSQSNVMDAKLKGFVVPSIKLSESQSHDEASESPDSKKLQDKLVAFSPKKSVQMLKYRVKNQNGEEDENKENEMEGENKENENSVKADSTWDATQDDTDPEDSGFEFGFEKKRCTLEIEPHKPIKVKDHEKIETEVHETIAVKTQDHEVETRDHGIKAEDHDLLESEDDETIKAKEAREDSDTDSFQQAASITSSCLDSLENASIVSAKEVTFTTHTAGEVSVEDRTIIEPYDDDMTAPLIPKSKHFETTIYNRDRDRHIFQLFRRSEQIDKLGLERKENDKNNIDYQKDVSYRKDIDDTAPPPPRGRRRPRPPPPGVKRLDYDTYQSLASFPEVEEEVNVPTLPSQEVSTKEEISTSSSPLQAAKEKAITLQPNISTTTLNKTKVTILPPQPFYPPSPNRPAPPPPPKDTDTTYRGHQTPVTRSEAVNRRQATSPTPSKKYKELNLRPPIPIVPLQQTMHLYGSTGNLPLPKPNHNSVKNGSQAPGKQDKDSLPGLPNFSRRRTLFGNHLTVPNANDSHLRRATYNSPSTHSVRLPAMPKSPGMQLPQRPGTSCGTNRPDSSASARSSKRERLKNFFKKF